MSSYAAIIPVWAQVVLGVIILEAAWLLVAAVRINSLDRRQQIERNERVARRQRTPFDWAEDDATVVDLFFDRDDESPFSMFKASVQEWAREERRHQLSLYGDRSSNVIALPTQKDRNPAA